MLLSEYGRQSTLDQTLTRLEAKLYLCTTPGCCTTRTDAGSNGDDPALSFVIQNHLTMYSMSCPMQAVEYTVKTWSAVCLMAPHSQSGEGARPRRAWTNEIAQHQSAGD